MTTTKLRRAHRGAVGKDDEELNDRQALFVREYLVDLDATAAAARAGYSAKTAKQQGHRLLTHATVRRLIQAGYQRRAERLEVDADRMLLEIKRLSISSVGDVVDWGVKQVSIGYDAEGRRLDPHEIADAVVVHQVEQHYVTPINRDQLSANTLAAVSEVGMTKYGLRIKMHDKIAALEKLGRHYGLFKDDGAPPTSVTFNIIGLYPEKEASHERPKLVGASSAAPQPSADYDDPARR